METKTIPNKPSKPPASVIIKRYKAPGSAKRMTKNEAIAVVAITITMGAPTKPADTAA